tara:strand:- start:1302 stop:1601 length:300 start_codon:yes stop_codon:yes gene_type:complete
LSSTIQIINNEVIVSGLMSRRRLVLQDGTKFSVYVAASGRSVITDFNGESLDKLLRLTSKEKVVFDSSECTMQEVYEKTGPFAAYIPQERDYHLGGYLL